MKNLPILLTVVLLGNISAPAQQVADTLFNPVIQNPAYTDGAGPVVFIDEAHVNFHKGNGRFKPFANVLKKDGYVVKGLAEVFTKASLGSGRILVIANALHPENEARWSLPTPSAFTDDEINAVNNWVEEGGSLFLIADHMPFPGAAEKLAASFGFKFFNGFAVRRGLGRDIFTPEDGLVENPITRGRNSSETVTSLQTFTGQAFEIPAEASPLVVLNRKYELRLPRIAWQFDKETETRSAENLVQGAFLKYGKGRIVVFGEAAMFTAQTQGGKTKIGMNERSASQNAQFLLNTIHWLDGIIE